MSEAQTKRVNPVILWAGGAVFVLLSLWGLHSLLRTKLPVRVARVGYQDLLNTVSTNGSVEPVESFEAHSPYAGTVQHIYVHAGDQVPKGKLLIVMDDTDARARLATATSSLRAAQASLYALENGGTHDDQIRLQQQINQAQMQVEGDTRALATIKQLQANGSASQNEVMAAQQRLGAAQSNLNTLQQRKSGDYSPQELSRNHAQVADAQAAYEAAENNMHETHVTAPFAGTVYVIPVNQTDFVQSGAELLRLADLTKLRVRAYFDEPDVGKLAVGQPVKIAWAAKPELSWNGHVESSPSDITAYGTRNVAQVLIALDDAPGPLLPNTNVTVTVTTLNRKNVLSIPREALHTDGPESYVYKVVDNRLMRTSVQIGAINLINVQITGGLKENDAVALSANSTEPLADGAEVTVIK